MKKKLVFMGFFLRHSGFNRSPSTSIYIFSERAREIIRLFCVVFLITVQKWTLVIISLGKRASCGDGFGAVKKSCFIVDTRCLDSLVYRLPHFLMKTLEANTPKVSIRSVAHGSLWTGPRSPGFPAPELTLSICNLIVFLWVSVLK